MSALQRDRERLYAENLPLAVLTALRLRARATAVFGLDDMVHAGRIGLWKAAVSFQPERRVAFASWAIRKIQGEILEQLRCIDFCPRSVREQVSRQRAKSDTGGQGDINPELTPASLDVRVRSREAGATPRFMDTVGSLMASPDPGPEARAVDAEFARELWRMVDRLPARERRVVTAYYREGMILKAIGLELGVSESRTLQLLRQGLARLRFMVGE